MTTKVMRRWRRTIPRLARTIVSDYGGPFLCPTIINLWDQRGHIEYLFPGNSIIVAGCGGNGAGCVAMVLIRAAANNVR